MLLSCQGNTIPVIKPTTPEDVLEKKRNISCGHGKEKYRHKRVEIDYSMLLNPTNENVSALFSYENGIVEPSKKCTPIEEEQVKYTIQRLNLDAKTVEDNRKTELDIINELFKDLTEEQKRIQLDGLLDETQAVLNPYFSTIKDNFGFMLLA